MVLHRASSACLGDRLDLAIGLGAGAIGTK